MILYRTIICSKLVYGSMIYGSARKSYLKTLNIVHHERIKFALGTLSTSPIKSFYVEANEPQLKLRREKLVIQYFLKVKSCASNPVYDCTLNPKEKQQYK